MTERERKQVLLKSIIVSVIESVSRNMLYNKSNTEKERGSSLDSETILFTTVKIIELFYSLLNEDGQKIWKAIEDDLENQLELQERDKEIYDLFLNIEKSGTNQKENLN